MNVILRHKEYKGREECLASVALRLCVSALKNLIVNASVTMAYLPVCAIVAFATDYDTLQSPFVDMFGQYMRRDWPGKVHAEEDLVAARIAEDAWLAENATGPI